MGVSQDRIRLSVQHCRRLRRLLGDTLPGAGDRCAADDDPRRAARVLPGGLKPVLAIDVFLLLCDLLQALAGLIAIALGQ